MQIIPILYSNALVKVMSTIQNIFERYGMMRQLELYGQENFGNFVIGGNHASQGQEHGGDHLDTYSCIYFIEYHSQAKMVEWQKLVRQRP